MASVEERERVVHPGHHGSGVLQWTALLTPVLAVFAQQQIAYGFVVWACVKEARVLVHLPTLVALGAIGWAGWHAHRELRRVGYRSVADERSSDGRARFMAATTLTLCAFALLFAIAMWLPTVFINPCRR